MRIPTLDQLQTLAQRGVAHARGRPMRAAVAGHAPGIMVCAVTALAATFLHEHYGGPQLLYALLIGLSLHFLSTNPQITCGVNFCAKSHGGDDRHRGGRGRLMTGTDRFGSHPAQARTEGTPLLSHIRRQSISCAPGA
ncbi:MAG: hypothetical protein Q8R01_14360 [Ramlibacter sp.]|nr:hypothetical protein [Ramlibacter sp.]